MSPAQHAWCRAGGSLRHPPSAAPAANVVIAEGTPHLVAAEPGCAGCQALSLHGTGGASVCKVPMPRAGALLAAGCLFCPLTAVQMPAERWGGRMPCLPHRVGGHN